MSENKRYIAAARTIEKLLREPPRAGSVALSAEPSAALEGMTEVRAYLKGAARAVDLGATIDSDAFEDMVDINNDRIPMASDWNAVGGDLAYALAKFK